MSHVLLQGYACLIFIFCFLVGYAAAPLDLHIRNAYKWCGAVAPMYLAPLAAFLVERAPVSRPIASSSLFRESKQLYGLESQCCSNPAALGGYNTQCKATGDRQGEGYRPAKSMKQGLTVTLKRTWISMAMFMLKKDIRLIMISPIPVQ